MRIEDFNFFQIAQMLIYPAATNESGGSEAAANSTASILPSLKLLLPPPPMSPPPAPHSVHSAFGSSTNSHMRLLFYFVSLMLL